MRVPGFETVAAGPGSVAFLRPEYGQLASREDLRDPDRYIRERGCQGEGRGPFARVSLGPSTATSTTTTTTTTTTTVLILKKYRRGGALGHLLPDLYLGWQRMLADLEASERARSFGVPVPAAAGLILKRRAPGLWSAYLLTEEIPESATLARTLEKAGRGEPAMRLAGCAVAIVRRLHDAGIIHRDLNLHNLIVRGGEMDGSSRGFEDLAPDNVSTSSESQSRERVSGEPGEREPQLFVIDLDGASIRPAPRAGERFANLSRLDRSYVKLFRDRGPLTHDDRRALLALYCGADAPMLSDFESRLTAHKRSLFLHARLW